jgi:hypothetical protein
MTTLFDLRENPFAVLGLSPRDGALRVQAVTKPQTQAAARVLLASRPRLAAELRWFPGHADEEIKGYLAAVQSGTLPTPLPQNPLAAACLAAHTVLWGQTEDQAALAVVIVQNWAAIDFADTLKAINSARADSSFPQIQDDLFASEVKGLMADLALAAFMALGEEDTAPLRLSAMVDGLYMQTGRVRPILDAIADRYLLHAWPRLRAIQSDIQRHMTDLEDTGHGDLEPIASDLRRWTEIAAPLHKIYEKRRLDEPATRVLGDNLRQIALRLAPTRPDTSIPLLHLIRHHWPTLTDLAAQIAEDLAKLGVKVDSIHPSSAGFHGALPSGSMRGRRLPIAGADRTDLKQALNVPRD